MTVFAAEADVPRPVFRHVNMPDLLACLIKNRHALAARQINGAFIVNRHGVGAHFAKEGLAAQLAVPLDTAGISFVRANIRHAKRFAGQQLPPLEQIPPVYARRYSLEHGFRVDKQDLLWEQVRLRTPEAFGHWTDIVACVRNQLCLARDLAAARQSWERSDRPPTPSQVRRAMGTIIRQLGTPASAPQVRGNAPGRQKGAKNKKATTFKIVFKGKNKPRR